MQDYTRLKAWKSAHALVPAVYHATDGFPRSESYSPTSQIRRAAVSIPSNIAEGCGCSSRPDFARILSIALGSCSELEYQHLLCRDLGFLKQDTYPVLTDDLTGVKRMLSGLLNSLKREIAAGQSPVSCVGRGAWILTARRARASALSRVGAALTQYYLLFTVNCLPLTPIQSPPATIHPCPSDP